MKYLIEGAFEGALFTEMVESPNMVAATDKAIARLCEAWGVERTAHTELADLGDAALVRQMLPSDLCRAAALDMFDALRVLLPLVRAEWQRLEANAHEAAEWRDLHAAWKLGADAIARAEGRPA